MTDNLITTWLALHTDRCESFKQALDRLNAELGTSYKHNHLSVWRRGKRHPCPRVINFMLADCIPYALAQNVPVAAMVEMLTLPVDNQ